MLDEALVLLDLETTGGDATRHRIIEIGLLEVRGGEVGREWRTFINPGCTLSPFISQFTGISDEMLAAAPRFEDIAPQLREMLKDRILVAHNARFDYGFLRNEFLRAGAVFSTRSLCTVRLSRALYPAHRSHSLDAIIERHGLSCARRHRALDDARLLWDFLRCVYRDHDEDSVQQAVAAQLRRQSLPPGVDQEIAERLPDSPGVYQFYDARGRLLYVGKSINIRSRVLAHFSSSHSTNKGMRLSRQLHDIRWIETAGELGALLLEASLIREHTPVHNRRLRRHRSLVTWRLDCSGAFHVPQLVTEPDFVPGTGADHFGLFRNRRAARNKLAELCAGQGLCPSILGLEKSTGPCFSYQLGRCRGACAGKESAQLHNLRLAAALAALRIASWPFPGTVGLKETDEIRGRESIHVLDNWCWLGSADSEQEVQEIMTGGSPAFDIDTYRILRSWLDKKADRITVLDLSGVPFQDASSA